jgi:putative ABC transport system permease protein
MNLLVMNRIALRTLGRSKMRTGLTTLGIAIGVGAVVSTVAIGEGAASRVHTAIENMGANMIWIEAGGVNVQGVRTGALGTRTLVMADADAIRREIPLVTNVTPQSDTGSQVIYGNQNWRTQLRGISQEYLALRKWSVVKGMMFNEQEVQAAAGVCVIGQTVVTMLFGNEDPIGETIRVRMLPCKVIGVLAIKGQSATGQDQDDTILMPYTTVMKKMKGVTWIDDILCSGITAAAIPEAEDQIVALLRERHRIAPGAPDDFNLRHPTEIAQTVEASARTMEMLLAAIASVSLLVGGIGVMNIMLVSVTERTREIGLRMSVGARGLDVQLQFLWEAVILSLIGGLIGTGLGFASSVGLADLMEWPVSVSPNAVVVAVAFSAAVGVFFGFYPARKAAKLDPIEALRYEG